jgi:hypothetical protein
MTKEDKYVGRSRSRREDGEVSVFVGGCVSHCVREGCVRERTGAARL